MSKDSQDSKPTCDEKPRRPSDGKASVITREQIERVQQNDARNYQVKWS